MSETKAESKVLTHDWCMDDKTFYERIDECGGWPVGNQFVSFMHQVSGKGRPCIFGNAYLRDGMWTTICEADDYYRWKLSPMAMRKIEAEIREKIAREIQR